MVGYALRIWDFIQRIYWRYQIGYLVKLLIVDSKIPGSDAVKTNMLASLETIFFDEFIKYAYSCEYKPISLATFSHDNVMSKLGSSENEALWRRWRDLTSLISRCSWMVWLIMCNRSDEWMNYPIIWTWYFGLVSLSVPKTTNGRWN